MIIIVAAAAENNALGKDNDLPWHLPDDFRHFKQLTSGHHIIMGRKTFESFPSPLPNRTHIVISRQADYNPEGCIVVSSLQEAYKRVPDGEDAYVIGGGQIFALAMADADRIELTRVHTEIEADVFFPEIDFDQWTLSREAWHAADERHAFAFTFQTWERNR